MALAQQQGRPSDLLGVFRAMIVLHLCEALDAEAAGSSKTKK
jgi:hypothetical protein